jgi:hypothetical protein
VAPASLPKADRQLGRGGWVWTRNWELDSVAYFMNFLWNYHQTPAVWRPEALLLEPQVRALRGWGRGVARGRPAWPASCARLRASDTACCGAVLTHTGMPALTTLLCPCVCCAPPHVRA